MLSDLKMLLATYNQALDLPQGQKEKQTETGLTSYRRLQTQRRDKTGHERKLRSSDYHRKENSL